MVEYAYVTVDGENYIGRHKSPDLKFAGELKEIGDCEWLTALTPVKRAPLGDTFLMEGIEGEANLTRHELFCFLAHLMMGGSYEAVIHPTGH